MSQVTDGNKMLSFRIGRFISALLCICSFVVFQSPVFADENVVKSCPKGKNVKRDNCQGSFILEDGKKYDGAFKANKRHGQGVLFDSNGDVLLSGVWENDDLVISMPVEITAGSSAPSENGNEVTGSGTGFRVAFGKFVTNYHVIDNCAFVRVKENLKGEVIAGDKINDLALISVHEDKGPVATIRTIRAKLNEPATAVGFPLHGAFDGISITTGNVSRLSGLAGDTAMIQISAPVQPGNSGGPLLDASGVVIGVVSSKLDAVKVADATGDIPQNINFAIGSDALRAFLTAHEVRFKEDDGRPVLASTDLADLAKGFTVLVECMQ